MTDDASAMNRCVQSQTAQTGPRTGVRDFLLAECDHWVVQIIKLTAAGDRSTAYAKQIVCKSVRPKTRRKSVRASIQSQPFGIQAGHKNICHTGRLVREKKRLSEP